MLSELDGYPLNMDLNYRPHEVIDLGAMPAEYAHGSFNRSWCKVNGLATRVSIARRTGTPRVRHR